MSHKSTGLFAFITGLAAGAAAVFFAKESNREFAVKEAKVAARTAQKIKAEIKKNPQAFEKKIVRQGKKLARQVLKTAPAKKTTLRSK
jgi:hypothetical protein